MSRKNIERQARQRFCLDAARDLFASKGVENTSMEDIATAVDYTRRTLYAYFKSRDDICLRVFSEDLRRRWELQQQAVAKADTGLKKIIVWGRSLYDYSLKNRHSLHLYLYFDFVGIDPKRVSDESFANFEAINDELAEGLRDLFRLGIEDQSLRPELQTDICISQYLYTLRSVIHRALSPTYSFTEIDPDEYVRNYLDLFGRAIRNNGGKTA